jgi:hypothetical protein
VLIRRPAAAVQLSPGSPYSREFVAAITNLTVTVVIEFGYVTTRHRRP